MKPRKALLAATAAALIAIFASCGTQKNSTQATTATTLTPSPSAGPAQRYASMTAAYGLWHDLRMPVRATLRSPMSISASGKLTMVRDSLVHVSMRVLGIEVAVVRATRDSVYVIDKFHRYLLAEPMAAVSSRTGIGLADMQNLLLGRAFVPGRGVATPAMAPELRLGGNEALLTIEPATQPAGYSWKMDATTLADGRVALSALSVEPKGSGAATCTFTPAAALTPAGALASALSLKATVARKTLDASLSYTLSEARYNSTAAPAMPSMRGYKRVSASTLLKSGVF